MVTSNAILNVPDDYRIRKARTEDTSAIYAVKVEAFGESYLLYTVYQAMQSISYLEQLIAESLDGSPQNFFVLEQDGRISGYYHAIRLAEQYFLNYVAVTQRARGLGFGDALLRHFEKTGKTIGCQTLTLDVFESNSSVCAWYYRHGYRLAASSFHMRLAIDALSDNGAPVLLCEKTAWKDACDEERIRGFSKFECECISGYITIGLIAGHTCKLIDYTGLSLKDAALAIASRFKDERQFLIISALPDLPSGWPILSAEKMLRLIKTVK